MPALDLQLAPHNLGFGETVLAIPGKIEVETLPREVVNAIRKLWRDPSVREAVQRSNEFVLDKSAVYYFNAIDRIAGPGYLPTDQDILRINHVETGVTEVEFKVGELTYKILDVGQQRGERRKWIHCFEDVTAILFLVSLNVYDQPLYEDESLVSVHLQCIYIVLYIR